jgi:hypothetical protein
MARRKQKRSPRKKFNGVRVLPALEAYVQTSIWTEAAFNTNPIQFLTGVVQGKEWAAGGGSEIITLPELVGLGGKNAGFHGTAGKYDNLQNALTTNLGGMEGVAMTALKSAGVGIGFKLINKMTRKARSGLNNQILKPLGVNEFIRI